VEKRIKKRSRWCIAYNGEYFEKKWQVSDWRSQFNKPTLLTSLISSVACSTSAVVTVFKAPYVVCKWLHVYHYVSSYRRQIEVFSNVCFIAVCEILYSREKKSTYFLKIPRNVKYQFIERQCFLVNIFTVFTYQDIDLYMFILYISV